jgi:energy-coupling factor transporter ATP-binding protein EcfA2
MKLTRLRLIGFKSFVEPTDFLIEPGLTGVVGPNGCGKSNLVEALRWVMGETSHKSMRAAEMDDVIFSGNNNRPARNTAEVAIQIDNSRHEAPALFNATPSATALQMHAPRERRATPAAARAQSSSYVWPSHPHTGDGSALHPKCAAQTPEAPHAASSGKMHVADDRLGQSALDEQGIPASHRTRSAVAEVPAREASHTLS